MEAEAHVVDFRGFSADENRIAQGADLAEAEFIVRGSESGWGVGVGRDFPIHRHGEVGDDVRESRHGTERRGRGGKWG